jgi:hypothetical protein
MALFPALVAAACGGDGQPRTPTSPTPPTSLTPVTGRYSLTLTVGPACTTLADGLRSRSYLANIDSRAADDYVVTLSDAGFLADEQIGERAFIVHCSSWYGLGCHQFTASREGDQLRFRLASNDERFNDEFAGYGGMIVEVIPPDGRHLGISGTGLGRLEGDTIHAAIDGRVWDCPARYTSADRECANCNGAEVAMTFTRR